MKIKLNTFLLLICVNYSFAQIITIDPGHGYCADCTQNCTSNVRSATEIETAVDVGNRLDALLANCTAVTTHLTRSTSGCGDFPSLTQRAVMSNNWNTDRFLSIHCNAGGGTGSETFWCNESVSSNAACQDFAQEIQDEIIVHGNFNSRRVVEDDTYLNFHLAVLRFSDAVGCLSEIGFVDHPADAAKLLDNTWRQEFAQAYFDALEAELGFSCGAGSPPPDLVVESMSTTPANPEAGEQVDLNINIKNVGTGGASNINLTYKIDGTTVGTDNHASLSPGAVASEVYDNYIFNSAGSYQYCVFIDAVAGEINTGNNSYCITIPVTASTAGEDITITSATATTSTNVNPGNTVSISAKQNYTGSSSTSSNVTLNYYLSSDCILDGSDIFLGDDISELSTSSTSETETATLTIPANTTGGNYNILLVADHTDIIAESNENNNTTCIPITVSIPSSPEDVIITAASATTSINVDAGDNLGIRCTQNYTGSSTTHGDIMVSYYLSTDCTFDASDIFLTNAAFSINATNNSATVSSFLTIPNNTATGTYSILMLADGTNIIAENNEGNNSECITIEVTGTPPPVSVQENMESGIAFSLFPNPNNGNFQLALNFTETIQQFEVLVNNNLGQLVYSEIFTINDKTGLKQIGRRFVPGTYFVTIKTSESSSTKLMLVE